MNNTVQTDEGTFIPATQRPDGTWRKARRVKDGYVPQDEVPLYESKGKQWANKKPQYPIGLSPELIAAAEAKKKKNEKKQQEGSSRGVSQSVLKPHVAPQEKKVEEKKKPSKPPPKMSPLEPLPLPTLPVATVEPAKRLKNLKKKIREIEALEKRIQSKELLNPDKDQLEKIERKSTILSEIMELQLKLNEN